jgi:hypothetical protein
MAWAHNHFPQVQKVLILRHPFAVALSKQKLKHWHWMENPKDFFKQRNLCADYLAPYEDFINEVSGDYFERQVLIWAIIHDVLFKQLSREQIHVVFYEELCANPVETLANLFEYLDNGENAEDISAELLKRVNVPSRFSMNDKFFHLKKSLSASWQDDLSYHQIDRAMEILDKFGLSEIYGTNVMPNKAAAARRFNKNETRFAYSGNC